MGEEKTSSERSKETGNNENEEEDKVHGLCNMQLIINNT